MIIVVEGGIGFISVLLLLVLCYVLFSSVLSLFSNIFLQLGIFIACAIPLTIRLIRSSKKTSGHIAISQLVLPAAAIIVMGLTVMVAVLASGHTVTLSDFVDVTFSGYDGAGTASVEISDDNYDAMMTYCRSNLKFNSESEKEGELYLQTHGYDDPTDLLSQYVKRGDSFGISLDSDSGLRNGDTVTLHWTFFDSSDEVNELMAHMDGDLDCRDIELTVSGLKEPYATSLSEIPEKELETVRSESERIFNSLVPDTWSKSERSLNSVDFLGYWFLEAKDLSCNRLYVVYEVHPIQYGYSADGSPTEDTFTYYWVIAFKDVYMTDEDQLFVDYTNFASPSEDELFYFTTYDYTTDSEITLPYYGYSDLDEMYQTLFGGDLLDPWIMEDYVLNGSYKEGI